MWADNADFCAKQYAGTGALKTDFTRYVQYETKKVNKVLLYIMVLPVHYQYITRILSFLQHYKAYVSAGVP